MNNLLRTTPRALWLVKGVLVCIVALVLVGFQEQWFNAPQLSDSISTRTKNDSAMWLPPAMEEIPSCAATELIRFGRELILHTVSYLGPQRKVGSINNGLNCQNCHLNAGAHSFAANVSAEAGAYPTFPAKPGMVLLRSGLSNAEVWEVTAFVKSMARPDKKFTSALPDLMSKPVDHPFGSYVDKYKEKQNTYVLTIRILESQRK